MEYINKKLPVMKIGTEIKWSSPEAIGIHFYEEGELHCGEPILNSLIKDGFIEEVKPRKYWVNEQALINLSMPFGYCPDGDVIYVKVQVID